MLISEQVLEDAGARAVGVDALRDLCQLQWVAEQHESLCCGAAGKRVGEALLKAVEAFAMQHGHTTLLLTTTPFLDSAIRLYERSGFSRTAGGETDLLGPPLFTMEKRLSTSAG